MTLLIGLNYDYSGQYSSYLLENLQSGGTYLTLKSTEGLAEDDYLIIGPKTDHSEIVQIVSVIGNTKLQIAAAKFNHDINTKIYRTSYNQMKFYECAIENGTYTSIASSTTEMSFAGSYTKFDYPDANPGYYYKRTFYNVETTYESNIDESYPWMMGDEYLYATPDELRMSLQFGENDYPKPADMRFFITVAMKHVDLDLDSGDSLVRFIATLLMGRVQVMKTLASKSIGRGYVQVNVEGRTVTKAYQEFILDAENTMQEYKEFVLKNGRREAASTNFMDNRGYVDAWTRQDIINLMVGTSNAIDVQSTTLRNYFDGIRRVR